MRLFLLVVAIAACCSLARANHLESSGKPKRKKGEVCADNCHCKDDLICWEHKCARERKKGQSCRAIKQRGRSCELVIGMYDYTNHDCAKGLVCWGTAQRSARDDDFELGVAEEDFLTGERGYQWKERGKTRFGSDCPEGMVDCQILKEPTCIPAREVGQSCRYTVRDCKKGSKCVTDGAAREDSGGKCSSGKKGHTCGADDNCRGRLLCVEGTCQ